MLLDAVLVSLLVDPMPVGRWLCVMTLEDRQTVCSVLLAATLSFAVVGAAVLSTVVLVERPRATLDSGLTNGLQPPPSHFAWNTSR